jgi:hypothetical protein
MSIMNDEELQKEVEHGNIPLHGDARVYRKVFDVLRREPGYLLPSSFADRVTRRIIAAHSSKDIYWLYAGVAGCFIAAVVSVALTKAKFSVGAFRFFSSYPGLVVFGIAFILALHWLDRKYVRKSNV